MPTKQLDWPALKLVATKLAERKQLSGEYVRRLEFEIKEIEKQGAGAYWADKFNSNYRYGTNKGGLVLPWLLKLTPIDPLSADHQITKSTDLPDIDVDCLPKARDKIKAYAKEKYGDEYACSVGTWQTFKFKSALQDTAKALGHDLKEVMIITKALPDDVDDLKDGGYSLCVKCQTSHNGVKCPQCGGLDVDGVTIGQVLAEHDSLRAYGEACPDVIDMAVRLLGKIRTMGKHAGGVIISNKKLLGNVPMGISKGADGEPQWTSMWTEGRNTQLSKFGYVKWDFLGLKTLQYINDACRLIERTRNCKFNASPWHGNDPEANVVGWYTDAAGNKQSVQMDDPEVFKMINELRMETIFQFETDVQHGVLSNGVRDYHDLQVFNAMGHPGPIAFIPEYVERRDDIKKSWKKREHPDVAAELEATHGIIVFQEQLQKLWQKFAGFTAPEAEAARKAVAKKWVEKLKPVKEQWLKGATKTLGKEWAEKLWERMQTFGRYAFNKAHSVAYVLVAYWCAWLKAHFAPEWWASVMSGCHSDRIPKYMNTARREGVQFGTISADKFTSEFSVSSDLRVTPGLVSIKGIGSKAAVKLMHDAEYTDIDQFVQINGKDKRVMEPLIKLGAFKKYHSNLRATWMWYQYKYCAGKDITKFKREIRELLSGDEWTDAKIKLETERQIAEYRKLWPNRKRIPASIANWKPKIDVSRQSIMSLFGEDFKLDERLAFEKQYLGYYWHSPLDLYRTSGLTIQKLKDSIGKRGKIEVVVEKLVAGKTKAQKDMGRLIVSDGLSECVIMLWSNQLRALRPYMKEGLGLRIDVKYDEARGSFTLADKDTVPIPLDLAE